MSDDSKSKIPSELLLSRSWDVAIERFLVNGSVGFVVGGLASLVLFRKPSSRFAFTTLGCGWGLGSAWTLNSIDFEKEKFNAEGVVVSSAFAPKTKPK